MASHKKSKLSFRFLIAVLLLISCSNKKESLAPEEKILVRIGDKTITVAEFIQRAEYTIRPEYCRADNYIHKKIVLNSLIAEKLLALEAEKNNALQDNEDFQEFIKGRREQAMRQWLYYQDAFVKVKLDTNEIKRDFKLAGREYKLTYFAAEDTLFPVDAKQKLQADTAYFKKLYAETGGTGDFQQKKLKWSDVSFQAIHDSIFGHDIKKGEVLGPIPVDDDKSIVIKVNGWSDTPAIAHSDILERWKNVSDILTHRDAQNIWKEYVSEIMRGKRVEFNESTFYEVEKIFAARFLKSNDNLKKAFVANFWQDGEVALAIDGVEGNEMLLDSPFFKIDGKVWTVREFRQALRSHPLVFRKKSISRREFPGQFKLSIVDFLQDYYVTRVAYKKDYDKINLVQRNENMWRDATVAMSHRNEVLGSLDKKAEFAKDYMNVINKYLNPYVDSLQTKYSDLIKIDMAEFEKLRLNRIDMFVMQTNQPYPVVVPSFPVITTEHLIDYGSNMAKQ